MTLATANAVAQSCEGEDAKAVKVVLDGCGGSEPAGSFNVVYGNDSITVSPKGDGPDRHWLWIAPNDKMKFLIGSRMLSIPFESMPRALAKCNATATAERSGGCMAVYVVNCQALWSVRVEMVPAKPDLSPLLEYQRDGKPTIEACPRNLPTGPAKVPLALTENLTIKIDSDKWRIPIKREDFVNKGKTELKLPDVPINFMQNGAITGSGAGDITVRKSLQKKIKEMIFTTAD
jgi:hypothetical protein